MNAFARLVLGFVLAAAVCAAEPRTVVFFGDSLTAGYGLSDPSTEAYPARIQEAIDREHLDWRVVNAGLSGETTAGGLRRIDWILHQPFDVFVIALGGNDGLRGIPTTLTEANLQAMIDKVRKRNPAAVVILAGMRMPDNLGDAYTQPFAALFPKLAASNHVTLIPFLLEAVAARPALNQADQIHPNAEGARAVASTVWKVLEPILRTAPTRQAPKG